MKKRNLKLTLNKETLRRMTPRGGAADVRVAGFDSCLESCFFQSCGGGCTISTEAKTIAPEIG